MPSDSTASFIKALWSSMGTFLPWPRGPKSGSSRSTWRPAPLASLRVAAVGGREGRRVASRPGARITITTCMDTKRPGSDRDAYFADTFFSWPC